MKVMVNDYRIVDRLDVNSDVGRKLIGRVAKGTVSLCVESPSPKQTRSLHVQGGVDEAVDGDDLCLLLL